MKKIVLLSLLLTGFFGETIGQSYTSTIVSGINEIAGTGTAVTLTASVSSSTSSGSLPIGFTFNFYGNAYTNFYINPTGTLSFSSANQNYLGNNIIPSTNTPNNFIGFAFINPYDNYPSPDLYPDYSSSNINYFTSGTAPNRILVVNFKNVVIPPSFPIASRTLNVQVQLSENGGKIEVHNTTSFAPYAPAYGRYDYLQIGVENIDGTNGTAATCRQDWNLNNQTVRFTYCSVSPSNPTSVTSSMTLCTATTPNTQSINLNATCASGAPVWYSASGTGSCIVSASSALTNTTVTPTATTSYRVRCESNGCNSNFVTTTITVADKIADPTNVTADQNICTAGSSINLVGSCTNTYPKWYDASNTLLSSYNTYTNYNALYNASVSVSPSASTTYTIKCENTSYPVCSGSKTVNVTVSTLSNPTAVTASQTICAGVSVNLQGTCATGTKEWGLWNGNIYAAFTNTNVSPTATSYYRVSCVNGTCSTYQTVIITVNALPAAPTSITKNPNTQVNPSTNVLLTATCASGNTIKWEDNSTTNPRTVNPVLTTTYSAKCVNGTCESATNTSTTITIANITVDNTTSTNFCPSANSSLLVNFTPSNVTGPFTVQLCKRIMYDSGEAISVLASGTISANSITLTWSSNLDVSISGYTTGYFLRVVANGINTYSTYSMYPSSLPTLSAITTNPATITTIGGGAVLSATCSSGTIAWYNALNTSIGTGTSTTITNQLKTEIFTAKCADGACSVSQTKRVIVEAVIAGADAAYNGGYFEGRGSYDFSCVSGVPGSRQNVGPYIVDTGTYQFSTVYQQGCNFSQTWSGNFITRKNNVWEIIYGASVSTGSYTPPSLTYTRKYHTKYLFTSNYPPCSAVWIKDADNSEVTLTNTGVCENASPIVCPTPTISSTVASPATINFGGSLTLTANGCSGGTVVWSNGGATTPTLTVSPTTNTNYTFVCTVAPCVITSPQFSVIVTPPPCPPSLSLSSTNNPTDDVSTGTTTRQANAATGTISATNKITGTGTKVTYQAKSINLNAGFKADNGTIFKAEVGGCN